MKASVVHALFTVAVLFLVFWLVSDPCWAGPGGVIKAAEKTVWGKVAFGVLCVALLPLVAWYLTRRFSCVRRTRKDLEAMAKIYPQYAWLDLRDRTIDIFNWVWSAWSQQKMQLAGNHATHWYWQNQQLLLNQWENRGVENVCEVKQVLQITPLHLEHVEHESGNCEGSRVVLEIKARVVDYLKDKTTGKVVEGDTKVGELETIWTLMWTGEQWRLNLIESDAEEFTYLGMKNQVPSGDRVRGNALGSE